MLAQEHGKRSAVGSFHRQSRVAVGTVVSKLASDFAVYGHGANLLSVCTASQALKHP